MFHYQTVRMLSISTHPASVFVIPGRLVLYGLVVPMILPPPPQYVSLSLIPSRTQRKYVWQKLSSKLGLSDVAIPDSG